VIAKDRLRTTAALATSVLLHLACAILVLRGVSGRRTTPPAPARPIEVSLMETAPVAPGRAAPSETSPAPPRRRTGGEVRVAPPHAPTSGSSPPTAPAPRQTDAAPATEAPARTERPPSLSFDALADRTKHRLSDRDDPGEALEQLLAPAPDPGERRPLGELREETERRARAEANVRAGRADPLLFDYLRDAQALLTPRATRIAEALPLGPSETINGWTRGYLGRVADAQHGAFAPVRPADEPFGGARPDVIGAYNEAERQAEAGAERRTAEVCLGVAPDHAVVVTLRRSSGNAELDRLATDAFLSAGAGRSADARFPPSRACYLVSVSAYRMPPLPAATIDFLKGRVLYPGKRITKVTVDLQSVDFGPPRGPPSLLRIP
jgi:hypothetical protein